MHLCEVPFSSHPIRILTIQKINNTKDSFMKKDSPPSSSSSNMSQSTLKAFDEAVMIFIDLFQEIFVISAIGLSELAKLSYRLFPWSIAALYGIFVITEQFVFNLSHLVQLHSLEPSLFTFKVLRWCLKVPLLYHQMVLLGFMTFIVCVVLGFKLRFLRNKFIKIFTTAGLTNGLGDTPKLVYLKRLDKFRVQYDFDANGIGIGEFEDKKQRIEAMFNMEIESINSGKHPGRVLVTFNKRSMPISVSYESFSEEKILPPDSFYVGQSSEGVITQKIADLPHMLVAGTTGSGKSVFFKQCLLSLLESSRNIQCYIIDLKGGLEAIDFKEAPNVKIVKKVQEAVEVLRLVEKEMMNRFAYLEKNNYKEIEPGRDKKDRIIIAVDEASVLYKNRSRYDDDFKIGLEARKLADSISKLSRAAAIHLVLATQKLDKEVIPTSVSENITGRMAFRSTSLQGSLVVLGNKDSTELPQIAGRGIWSVGNKKVVVQAPYIKDVEIKSACKRIANEFAAKERFLNEPMIGQAEEAQAPKKEKALNKMILGVPVDEEIKEHDRGNSKRH